MIDDKILREVLERKIKQIKEYPRSAQKEVESIMAKKYNVRYGDTVDIFNGLSPLSVQELTYDMLYKLMKSIYAVTIERYMDLDPTDLDEKMYFTEGEIIEFSKPYPTEIQDIDLVITDWKKINDYKYTIWTDMNELIKWRDYNKLRFNPETQRDLVVIESKGIPVKRLDINRKAIREMKKLMLSGRYYPVRGTININPEYFDPPIIEGGNLIIPMETHMDLIEGFHNYTAECELKKEHPEWNMECEFDIMFLTKDEANDFIFQMDRKNHFKESQITRIDKSNPYNYVIDQINKNTEFHLHGTIDNDYKFYLNILLSKIFELEEDRKKELELSKQIVEKVNYFIEKLDHYNINLNKEEWFVCLYIIKKVEKNGLNFQSIIDNINIESTLYDLNIKKEPSKKHYKLIDKKISEVISNGKFV